MFSKRLRLIALILCFVTLLCGCSFDKSQTKGGVETATKTESESKTESKKSTEKDTDVLPNTIDTYAKNYTEVGEVFPTKSLTLGDTTQTEVKPVESKKAGMVTYTSDFGYSIEYPENYVPQKNFDSKEFIILDEKSGSNMNVIITYPNILYESEDHYREAIKDSDDMRLKKFKVTEINGVNAVQLELAIVGGYAYQTIYRTGQYYYILTYVQGRGVTRTFDDDMKAVINSLKLN